NRVFAAFVGDAAAGGAARRIHSDDHCSSNRSTPSTVAHQPAHGLRVREPRKKHQRQRDDSSLRHSPPFTSSQSASNASSDASPTLSPRSAAICSTAPKRRANLTFAVSSASAGCTPAFRQRFTTANKRSPNSASRRSCCSSYFGGPAEV